MSKNEPPQLGVHRIVMPSTTDDLRVQATRCQNPRAAAILISVASWLEGKPATDGNLEPHQFADLWTDDPCSGGCRMRNAVRELLVACKVGLSSLRHGGIVGRSPETDTLEAAINRAEQYA